MKKVKSLIGPRTLSNVLVVCIFVKKSTSLDIGRIRLNCQASVKPRVVVSSKTIIQLPYEALPNFMFHKVTG